MFTIISNFIQDLLNNFFRAFLEALKEAVGSLFKSAFLIETLPGLDSTVLSTSVVQSMTRAVYGFMILLLALKLIWKGWNVYILWRDGEAETPPGELVIGAVYALVAAAAFPLIYEGAVSVVMEIAKAVLEATGWAGYDFSGSPDILGFAIDLIDTIGRNMVSSFIALVFILAVIVLIFKLLSKGAELLLWRLGFPIAAVGLVNSDGGAFKAYAQICLKELATVLAQYFCLLMGICIASSGSVTGLLLGVVFETTGISAPKLLAQFLSPSGGGGMTQKISTVAMVARTFGA